MKPFFIALGLLTTIPAPVSREASPKELSRAVALFPVVGLIIGGAIFATGRLAALVLPAPLPATLMVAVLCVVTGCLHLDGLADSADGLFGAHSGKDPIEIMKDPRVGLFGVAAVAVVLMLKFAGLATLRESLLAAALFPVLGRWGAVVGLSLGRPAAKSGLGTSFCEMTGMGELLVGGVVTLALSVIIGGRAGLAGFVAVSGLAFLMVLYFRRRVGGITGDLAGAMIELSEVAALIILAGFSG